MKRCLLMLSLALAWLNLLGQNITVSGRVTSSDGEPLPGVSILVVGTSTGTLTDVGGNYSVGVPNANAQLQYSFIGYETSTVTIDGRSVIDVSLQEEVTSLSEVVVIAYGETERRKFTGSLSTVSAAEIGQIPQTSAIQMIQGRSAGVLVEDDSGQPGQQGKIIIRGVGTLTDGAADPLYVIDGTPTNSIGSLNSNDIESISVLKDAAATSIYGSRAANGVVLITTKQGAIGKTKFSVNAQYGFADIENSNNFKMMNSTQYTEYYREAYLRLGQNPDDPGSGFYLPVNSDSIDTDWQNAVLRTGKTQLYELTASGGTEKIKHYLSTSYYKQEGVVIGTNYERFTSRFNFGMAPTDRVNIDLMLLGAYTDEALQPNDGGRSGTFSGSFNVAPTAPIMATPNTPSNFNGLGYNFQLPSNAGHNPVASNAMNSNVRNELRIFPTLRLTYEPIDNLTLSTMGSVDYRVRKRNSYQSKFYVAETDNGLAELENELFTDANFNATAKYEYEINSDHKVTPLFGFETFKRTYTNEVSESRDFAFDGINNFAAGSIPLGRSYDFQSNTLLSTFARVNYAFRDKLFVDLSLRRDGSSRFGPDNRYGTFYSIGAGYNLSDETFMQSIGFLNDLRLRASYGIQGSNAAAGDFAWRSSYGAGGAFIVPPAGGGTGLPNSGSQPNEPGNTRLKWEQNGIFNVGVDFAAVNNRLSGTIEYYNRASIDLLANRIISRTSGFESIIDNVGKVENRGIEISLNSSNIKSGDFEWKSGFNISFNTNEIVSLNGEADTLVTNGGRTIRVIGQPIDQWYLPQYAGVDPANGRPMYYGTEGGVTYNINNALRTVSGQTANTPDFFGSFSNSFTYKNITLSAMFYFKYGFEVYRENLQNTSVPSGNNQPVSNLSRWQVPGDITSVPRADDTGALFDSNRWLEDGSYIRLRNVSLSYLLPQQISSKVGMKNINLSVRGVNVLTFTNFRGFNPDTGYFEDDDYPINRTITFGISAQF